MHDSERGDIDRFSDIELNRIEEIEVENHPGRHFQQIPQKKKDSLSLLSRRTLIVSLLILIGFGGIFMWPWIFEALGVIPWFGKEIKDEVKITQATEMITLPVEKKEFPELAVAPSPVRAHAVDPVPKTSQTEKTSETPKVSKTTATVQGFSNGGTSSRHSPVTMDSPNVVLKAQPERAPETSGDIKKLPTYPTPTIPVLPETEQPVLKPEPINTQQEKISIEEVLPSHTELQSALPLQETSQGTLQETKRFSKQETLLLNRKPEHYTIQIIGMNDAQKLKHFINQSPLKTKMVFYKTMRGGKAWYVVVYGDFKTKRQAEAAMLTLPKDIQKNKPWARSVRAIQEAIRDKS